MSSSVRGPCRSLQAETAVRGPYPVVCSLLEDGPRAAVQGFKTKDGRTAPLQPQDADMFKHDGTMCEVLYSVRVFILAAVFFSYIFLSFLVLVYRGVLKRYPS